MVPWVFCSMIPKQFQDTNNHLHRLQIRHHNHQSQSQINKTNTEIFRIKYTTRHHSFLLTDQTSAKSLILEESGETLLKTITWNYRLLKQTKARKGVFQSYLETPMGTLPSWISLTRTNRDSYSVILWIWISSSSTQVLVELGSKRYLVGIVTAG
jgi:hypothetical protein